MPLAVCAVAALALALTSMLAPPDLLPGARGAVIAIKARDPNPPVFTHGTPRATHITDTSLHLEFRMDKQGFIYYIVLPVEAPEPHPTEVRALVGPRLPPPNNRQRWQPILTGTRTVTTITRLFIDTIFEELALDTAYNIWCVAEDNFDVPEQRYLMAKATLVPVRTLSGRVKTQWEGTNSTYFLDGYNVLGVGTSATHNHNTPTLVNGWGNVSASLHHEGRFTTLWHHNGTALNIGDIWHGRLTISSGNDNQWSHPTKDSHVSSGAYHWLSVMYDHRVLALGHNEHGRLGLGDTVVHLTATAVPGMTNVSEAAAALDFSVVLNEGKIYTFGHNNRGQLGLNDTLDRMTPTLVHGFESANGTVMGTRYDANGTAVVPPALGNVTHISAGRDHYLFTTAGPGPGGQLYAVGANSHGQLGTGDNVDRPTPTLIAGYDDVRMVMAGNYHSVFLNGSRLLSMGYNFRQGGDKAPVDGEPGVFYGYSPTSAKCYQLHGVGCLDEY